MRPVTTAGTKQDLENRKTPLLYELIDKDGHWAGSAYDPKWLAKQAKKCWPDQTQDDERSGKGWHVKVVGS